MGIKGEALTALIGNVKSDGIQTLNAGTGKGYGDFLGFTANAAPSIAPTGPSIGQP